MSSTTQRRPRLRRRLTLTALLAVVALALSGCIKLDYDLNINASDQVSGTLIIALNKQLLAASGDPDSALASLTASAPIPAPSGGGTVVNEKYDDGTYAGTKVVLTDVALSEFCKAEGGSDSLRICRDGEFIRLTGTLDLSSSTGGGTASPTTESPTGTATTESPTGTATTESPTGTATTESPTTEGPSATTSTSGNAALAPALPAETSPSPSLPFDPSLLLSGFQVMVKVTFPGQIVEANGTIEGNTVTWKPSAGSTAELKAVARSPLQPVSSSSTSRDPLVGLAGRGARPAAADRPARRAARPPGPVEDPVAGCACGRLPAAAVRRAPRPGVRPARRTAVPAAGGSADDRHRGDACDAARSAARPPAGPPTGWHDGPAAASSCRSAGGWPAAASSCRSAGGWPAAASSCRSAGGWPAAASSCRSAGGLTDAEAGTPEVRGQPHRARCPGAADRLLGPDG